ncbi:type II toxin-antitoxin system RelE family toxin [Rubrivirga sp. IMCC45206]|uniref:type II toxin-antitoxin system RelE family toxin n=1 Tax=Rubrivirga sp. IMCC45206 TaxID=3391614 RepID=UPI00398FC0B4
MARYEVVLSRNATKALHKASPRVIRSLEATIDQLADQPRPRGLKTIDSAKKIYRVRAGSYRILYQIQDARLVVHIIRIGDRKEVYQRVDDLISRTLPPPKA